MLSAFLERIRSNRLVHDHWRLILFVGAIALVLWLDSWLPAAVGEPHLSPVLTGLSIIAAAVIAAHFGRRMIAPYIDLDELVTHAKAGNVAAAVVVVGALLFVAIIAALVVVLLR